MPGKDALGQPTFSDSDPVNLAVDLTSAAAAVRNGVVRRGTQAERLAVTPVYAGLEWEQTDGTQSGRWRHNGTGWEWKGVAAWRGKEGADPFGTWTIGTPPAGAAPIVQGGFWKGFSAENTFGNAYFPRVTFPTSFPGGLCSVIMQQLPFNSAETPDMSVTIDAGNKDNFRPVMFGKGSPVYAAFSWIAIGY